MIARRALAVAAVPVALFASACGGGARDLAAPTAARVGDETLTFEELDDQIRGYAAIPGAAEQFAGTAPGNWSTSQVSAVVNGWVNQEIIFALGDDLEIEVSDDELAAARTSIVGETDVSGVPDEVIERVARAEALRQKAADAVAEEEGLLDFTEEEVAAAFEQAAPSLEQICVSQIVLYYGDPTTGVPPTDADVAATTERADAVLDRLDQGEAFAVVATAESDDEQTAAAGGEAGCFAPSELQDPELAAAVSELEAGEWSPEPFDFGQGLLLFQVDSRETPTIDDARTQIEDQLRQAAVTEAQTLVGDRMAALSASLDVTIDPRFGAWDPTTLTLTPPTGPVPPSTTTSSLDLAELGIDPSQLEGP